MAFDVNWLSNQFPDLSSISAFDAGGQKEVFKATHSTHGSVVLKVFLPHASEPERVKREILAVQQINSPKTPKVFDSGVLNSPTGTLIWLVEEFVGAPSLRKILSAGQRLTDREILVLSRDLLTALAAAEQVHIVHRDVKPDNILFDLQVGAWLLDFGLSRHLKLVSVTGSGNMFGACTPGYGPPEQFRNKKGEIDGRADLFALGITLYECIENINPFTYLARDVLEIYRRVESTQLPSPGRNIEQTGQFNQLIVAMTRTRRDHRPRTVAQALSWMSEICNTNGVV